MRVVVLASQKGGVGKTTLAAHIAVAAEVAGAGPAVLIDTDPQASLADWWNVRQDEAPAFSPAEIGQLKERLAALAEMGIEVAVIDTPPAMTASIAAVIEVADLVLVPTRPSPHDLRAVGRTVDLVESAGKPFAFVVNGAKPNAGLTVQAMAALSEHGPVARSVIHDRVEFASAMIDGRTVFDINPKGKSAQEVAVLWDYVQARIKESTKSTKRRA